MHPVAAVKALGIETQPLVEIAVARQVMVDPDDVGSTFPFDKKVELILPDAVLQEGASPGVEPVDAPAEEVEAKPPTLVFAIGLVLQERPAENFAEVFGLDKSCAWRDAPDGAHGEHGRAALRHECPQERPVVSPVRV